MQIFNLNITQINLPRINNPSLIEAYEEALSFELMEQHNL
jgi:hypothetical protein